MTAEQLGKAIQQKASDVACVLDYSTLDAKRLVCQLSWTFRELECIQREIFDWAAEAVKDPHISGNRTLVVRCHDIAWRAVPIVIFLIAVRVATLRELQARGEKNKTSFYFGMLKLATDCGVLELQGKAWAQLRAILMAIPFKLGWFHPEGRDGWKGVINIGITKLLRKCDYLDTSSTLEHMAEKKFAYVHNAIQKRMIDEIRRNACRPFEVSIGHLIEFREYDLEETLHKQGAIAAANKLRADCAEEPDAEILQFVIDALRSSEDIKDLTPKQVRGRAVSRLADNREVSPQQARQNMREFEARAQIEGSALSRLSEELRYCGAPNKPLIFKEEAVGEKEASNAKSEENMENE